ncbi:MAG: rRNA maturation RNase YbeY [Deltaproteobacteria bacterium]|nr:rRNA maturation RNase YbeY [Deltaproteobacteria bacterium]
MFPVLTIRRVSVRQHLRPPPLRGDRLRALVRRALTRIGPASADVRVLVVGDEDMERWNRAFLGRPRTTNVISFPEDEPGESPPGRLAGDILVSAPTCLRQTRGWPGSPEERVFFFVVHGLLHLCGRDHERGVAESRRMRKEEMEIYESILGKGTR